MCKPDQQHTNSSNSSLVQNLCLSHLIIAVTPLVDTIIPTPDTPTSVAKSILKTGILLKNVSSLRI